jgi:hypothetical protein
MIPPVLNAAEIRVPCVSLLYIPLELFKVEDDIGSGNTGNIFLRYDTFVFDMI